MVTASTQAVATQAQSALRESKHHFLRTLTVERTPSGEILITGNVRSFYQKQKAQEFVRNVAAGVRVVNDIEVD